MKALLIYDSRYGNTEKIACAIALVVCRGVSCWRAISSVWPEKDKQQLGTAGERHDEHKRQTKSSQDFTATLPANRLPFDGCGRSDPLRHYGSSA